MLIKFKKILHQTRNVVLRKGEVRYKTPDAFITFLAKTGAMYSIPFSLLEGIAQIFAG